MALMQCPDVQMIVHMLRSCGIHDSWTSVFICPAVATCNTIGLQDFVRWRKILGLRIPDNGSRHCRWVILFQVHIVRVITYGNLPAGMDSPYVRHVVRPLEKQSTSLYLIYF